MFRRKDFKTLSPEELNTLTALLRRRGVDGSDCLTDIIRGGPDGSDPISVFYETRGRTSVCILRVCFDGAEYFCVGAARKDRRDEYSEDVGRQVAFSKAVKDLAFELLRRDGNARSAYKALPRVEGVPLIIPDYDGWEQKVFPKDSAVCRQLVTDGSFEPDVWV